MAGDQQFCLRWNNHQSTLTSVFGILLENSSLLDCSLAAEGQCLKAHRILLSACSPYFQHLISQNPEHHPIFILKDVTFRELQALMDYMYNGQVNVSQEELGNLLKVAESLKIKGLSETGEEGSSGNEQTKRAPSPTQPTTPRSGLPIEHRRSNFQSTNDLSPQQPPPADGSLVPRKRKRTRRRSSDDEYGHNQSLPTTESLANSFQSDTLSLPQSVPLRSSSKTTSAVIPDPALDLPDPYELSAHQVIIPKTELPMEHALVPKQEIDATNDDNFEDLTLDDSDMMDDSHPGPSHESEGSNSQGFPPWQMSADESVEGVLTQSGEGASGTQDPQDETAVAWPLPVINSDMCLRSRQLQCPYCDAAFDHSKLLKFHLKECGKIISKTTPSKTTSDSSLLFKCSTCNKTCLNKETLVLHSLHACPKSLSCPNCSRIFKYEGSFSHHVQNCCVKSDV